jgi:transcriptional regulator with XRE-family HTH domain
MSQRDDMSQAVSWQIHWGRLLRTARQVAGLSLTELAAATGLTKGYLSKLESGHATALNPSRATLASLAQALPSFRPIAHSLGPTADSGPVAIQPDSRDVSSFISPDVDREPPVSLGWPELELIVAIVTLERAAVVQPLTAIVIARSVGRERIQIEATLARLVEMRLLWRRPPTQPGSTVSYQCAADFGARIGIMRPGDALVLAAALLAELPSRSHHAPVASPSRSADKLSTSS